MGQGAKDYIQIDLRSLQQAISRASENDGTHRMAQVVVQPCMPGEVLRFKIQLVRPNTPDLAFWVA
jgi:hypothetical protein